MTPARFPSVAQVRDIKDAVDELLALVDELSPPWTATHLVEVRTAVGDIHAEFAALRRERDGLRPKPMGARGWPLHLDRALEDIHHTMQRLVSSWELRREVTVATMLNDGIGDHPSPVLEEVDRTRLAKAKSTLERMLRKVDRAGREQTPSDEEVGEGAADGPRSVPPPHRPSLPTPLDRAVAAVRAWFKAIDDHPECHPGIASLSGMPIPYWSASRKDMEKLADGTVELLEADEALHALGDSSPDERWETTEDLERWEARRAVTDFVQRAKPWIGSWGWEWAFRPDRRAYVLALRDRFTAEVDRPLMGAARMLFSMAGDAETRDEVKGLVLNAIRDKCEPMGGGEQDARRCYDELLGPYLKGPSYGCRQIEPRIDLLCELSKINLKLTRWVEAREAAYADRQVMQAELRTTAVASERAIAMRATDEETLNLVTQAVTSPEVDDSGCLDMALGKEVAKQKKPERTPNQARVKPCLPMPKDYIVVTGPQITNAFPLIRNKNKFKMAQEAVDLQFLTHFEDRGGDLIVLPADDQCRNNLLQAIVQTKKNRKAAAKNRPKNGQV